MNGGECAVTGWEKAMGEYTMREMWENFIRNLSAREGESSNVFQAFGISLPPEF